MKLLNETLEEISPSTYCTDSAEDIVNWLLNKPKPYRILYDKYLDVWCIADATMNTHKDMSIDMFDSGYLYNNPEHIDIDSYVMEMRKERRFNDGYTDAEVYSDYAFRKLILLGCFFIPDGKEYRDYEESGFYSVKTKITTGTIFTNARGDLEDFFTPLYNKLRIAKAFVKEDVTKDDYEWLEDLAQLAKEQDPDCWVEELYYLAIEDGFSENKISQFLDKWMLKNINKNSFNEVYNSAPLMNIRNQLMNKLGDAFKATGGGTTPKVIITSVEDPELSFDITTDGKNVDITPKHDGVPDTLNKKRGIAFMRAANVLYNFIMQEAGLVVEGKKVSKHRIKLTVDESKKTHNRKKR